MKKVIIFDLDGTAVDSPVQKLPSKRLREAVKKLENSHYLCAATGRAASFAEDILKSLGLKDPCIISGGTNIINPLNGQVLWRQSIEDGSLEGVLKLIKETGYNVLADDSNEKDYLSGGWPFSKIKDISQPYFLELVFVPESHAHEVAKRFAAIPNVTATVVVAQRPNTCDIHITHKQATKEHAIIELCSILKTDRREAIGIGDGHNDLHLFTAVGHKVAMGNAVPELKAVADVVIETVKNDGLAQYFEELAKP